MSEPPDMFRRPTDPPDPLPLLRAEGSVVEMHREWARMHGDPSPESFMHRLRSGARKVRARIRGDDHYLGYVVRAVDDVAARCDELAQRLNHLAISIDDLSRSISEDVTRLRAEVEGTPRAPSESSRSSLP